MAQNYHKKSTSASKRRGEQRSGAFTVFLSGFILGVIACQLIPFLLQASSTQSISGNRAEETKAPAAPDFQFPNLLKGGEINIPQTDDSRSQNTDASYLLQVGSFKKQADAESLRVKLLLLNLDVFTEAFKTSSGDKWHRVLVGPFSSSQESSKARVKLLDNNLDSLLLKRDNL